MPERGIRSGKDVHPNKLVPWWTRSGNKLPWVPPSGQLRARSSAVWASCRCATASCWPQPVELAEEAKCYTKTQGTELFEWINATQQWIGKRQVNVKMGTLALKIDLMPSIESLSWASVNRKRSLCNTGRRRIKALNEWIRVTFKWLSPFDFFEMLKAL